VAPHALGSQRRAVLCALRGVLAQGARVEEPGVAAGPRPRCSRPTALLPGGLAPQLRSRKAAARAAAATRAARASVRVIHKANKAGLGKGEP
jgi:hypothetical protein